MLCLASAGVLCAGRPPHHVASGGHGGSPLETGGLLSNNGQLMKIDKDC